MSQTPELPFEPSNPELLDVGIVRGPDVEAIYDHAIEVFSDERQGDVAHLVTFEGDHIQITRSLKPEVAENATSIGGLFKRLTSPFRKVSPAVSDPYRYKIVTTAPGSNEQVSFSVAAYANTGGLYSLGDRTVESPDGDKVTTNLGEVDLQGYIADVQAKLPVSERFRASAMLEAEQLNPSARIEGPEAANVYKSLMPTIRELSRITTGSSELPETFGVSRYIAIRDTLDGLPVSRVNAFRSQFSGDTIAISVVFTDHAFEGQHAYAMPGDPFMVDITRRIDADGQNTLVMKYRLHHQNPFDGNMPIDEPLYLDPATRVRVATAIKQQVRPDNIREK
ncbi:MAG: hypothetical protein ABWX94_02125 [Candidatus Saccharimonadales bacterium]